MGYVALTACVERDRIPPTGIVVTAVLPGGCPLNCAFCIVNQRDERREQSHLSGDHLTAALEAIDKRGLLGGAAIVGDEPLQAHCWPMAEAFLRRGREMLRSVSVVLVAASLLWLTTPVPAHADPTPSDVQQQSLPPKTSKSLNDAEPDNKDEDLVCHAATRILGKLWATAWGFCRSTVPPEVLGDAYPWNPFGESVPIIGERVVSQNSDLAYGVEVVYGDPLESQVSSLWQFLLGAEWTGPNPFPAMPTTEAISRESVCPEAHMAPLK